jgi:fatty acid desaturase
MSKKPALSKATVVKTVTLKYVPSVARRSVNNDTRVQLIRNTRTILTHCLIFEAFRLAIGGWFYWYCLPGCLLFFKLLANAKKSGRRMS